MKDETLDIYNSKSKELADYFRGIGSRVWDIDKALELAGKTDGTADVLEVGCGDGRDATEIVGRVATYLGIDYSEGMLNIARATLPSNDFRVSRVEDFDYPADAFDVVFAFAVFLHIDKDKLALGLGKIAGSLRRGGILYMSNKYADEYKEEIKHDKFGDRMFYYYNPEIIEKLAGPEFETVEISNDMKGSTHWFQMGLRKI